MKVTRILHASFNVQGHLDSTVAYYRERLRLEDEARPHIEGVEGHWFRVGDAQLHLVDADAGPGPVRPTGPHVCVGVEDLDAAVAELEAAGVEYVRARQGEVVQIWIADPAGNTIELQQD